MRFQKTFLFRIGCWASVLMLFLGTPCTTAQKIRTAAVAGQFYPADATKLTRAIESYLAEAKAAADDKPLAIVSPHAGYLFSGQICADAFKQAAGFKYNTVILIGPNHSTPGFDKVSVYRQGGYQTPLGTATVNTAITSELLRADPDFVFNPAAHAREHANEVMVPFVQHLFPHARIVPIIIGRTDSQLSTKLGQTLARIIKRQEAVGHSILMVASSDLSHYPDYQEARKVDSAILNALLKMDPDYFQKTIRQQMSQGSTQLKTCACGQAPIQTVITAANALGNACARIISYANSGDTAMGRMERVVGYGAVSICLNIDCQPSSLELKDAPAVSMAPLTPAHKKRLLELARKSIKQMVESDTPPLIRENDPRLNLKQGTFVTLKKEGRLRGCIGHMAQSRPLCQNVGAMAISAAFNDPRFPPLNPEEFDKIEIEISVLTPFRPVQGPNAIQVGRDGVLINKNGRQAVFLPQVAVEQGWNRDQLLNNLCLKAGLDENEWRQNAALFTFQAIVFDEAHFRVRK